MKILALLTIATWMLISISGGATGSHYKIVCYLGSWANYRNGDGKFVIEDIDPSLCTHLIYGFAKLGNDNKIAAYDPYLDLKENYGLGAYERFTALKKRNPNLKTLLAIGGWNEGSTKYSLMARQRLTRKVFIDSCVDFLKKYGFDGLDLDWEYPATRGGIPNDKANFASLLEEMKESLRANHLLLTAAVSAGKDTIDQAYDVPALGKYLDLVNLMTYDFHGGWDTTTGHNAPLYPRPEETLAQRQLNVDFAVNYWIERGIPAEKLILGMALYGRSFTLQNILQKGLDAPVSGKGPAGPYTREQGFLGYNEICDLFQKQKDWTVIVNKYVQAPYAVKDRQWIGYDDRKSISKKTDYLIKNKLGGAMVWSIETDDFRGKCHGQRYPLLHTIRDKLNNGTTIHDGSDEDNSISSTTEQSKSLMTTSSASSKVWSWSTTSSSRPWSTEWSSSEPTTETPLQCTRDGYFRHPEDCKIFYLCQSIRPGSDAGFRIYLFRCGAGTVFSESMHTCAFPSDVPDCTHVKN